MAPFKKMTGNGQGHKCQKNVYISHKTLLLVIFNNTEPRAKPKLRTGLISRVGG